MLHSDDGIIKDNKGNKKGCSHFNESQKFYIKWKKPDIIGYILYYPFIWNLG